MPQASCSCDLDAERGSLETQAGASAGRRRRESPRYALSSRATRGVYLLRAVFFFAFLAVFLAAFFFAVFFFAVFFAGMFAPFIP